MVTPDLDAFADALSHHRAGRIGVAEASYRQLLQRSPREARVLRCLGLLLLGSARADDAAEILRQAVAVEPSHGPAIRALGRALLETGRDEAAAAVFQTLPTDADALAGLACALVRRDPAAAWSAAEAAIRRDPGSARVWFARGTALRACGRAAEAEEALREAARRDSADARTRLNLGSALLDLDRRVEAEAEMREAIRLEPGLVEGLVSLATLLTGDGRLAEAIALCQRAAVLRPTFAQARWTESFARLLDGDYARGWDLYEWRKRHPAYQAEFRRPSGEEWDGGPIDGRRLLVLCEQGLGDAIQFARYLPALAGQGAEVTLSCAPALAPLLAGSPGVARIVPRGSEGVGHDLWVDQMSLPRLIGTEITTIPLPRGYLAADPPRVAHWASRLPSAPRVGLVWAGNPAHSNDRHRSIPPAATGRALAPILAVTDFRFISLQVGARADEAASLGLSDHSSELTDFAETAALVTALDLVVTVDTSVAHLAGALGVPCWVMLPFAPDWRWMHKRTDSPWYASVRLFRQSRAGDWDGLGRDVACALRRDIARRAAA